MYGKLTDGKRSRDKVEVNLEVLIMFMLNNYCIDLMSAPMEICIFGTFLLHTWTDPVMFRTLKQQMVSSLAISGGVIPLWCSLLMADFPSQFNFEEDHVLFCAKAALLHISSEIGTIFSGFPASFSDVDKAIDKTKAKKTTHYYGVLESGDNKDI
ncbi:hypothetical protein MKW92_026062, partial [Papaver armeniacum]